MRFLTAASGFFALLAAMTAASIAIAQSEEPVWIDVRTVAEFQADHIDGALNIEFVGIVEGLSQRKFDLDTPVYLYCRSGRRSGIAKQSLEQAGYTQVINAGGLAQAKVLQATAKSLPPTIQIIPAE